MVIPSPAGHQLLTSFLTDGGSVFNFVGDYRDEPTGDGPIEAFLAAPVDETIVLTSVAIHWKDVGNPAPNQYGAGPQLIAGITVQIRHGVEVLTDFTGGGFLRSNADWGLGCRHQKLWTATDKAVHGPTDPCAWTGIWDVDSIFGQHLYLQDPDDRFVIRLNDDFRGLIDHFFLIHGFYLHRDSHGVRIA